MKEFKSAAKPPKTIPNKKFQSVKGIGQTGPDFAQSIYLANGCMVPKGANITYPQTRGGYGYLSHNEYVVYDTTQIRIKYLLELRNLSTGYY